MVIALVAHNIGKTQEHLTPRKYVFFIFKDFPHVFAILDFNVLQHDVAIGFIAYKIQTQTGATFRVPLSVLSMVNILSTFTPDGTAGIISRGFCKHAITSLVGKNFFLPAGLDSPSNMEGSVFSLLQD